MLRTLLILCAIFALLTGLTDVVLGSSSLDFIGDPLSEPSAGNATLDSQVRFFGVVWAGYGVVLFYALRDLVENKTFIQLILFLVFLSGIGRLISLLLFGLPAVPMIAATALELIAMPILILWLQKFRTL
tara:strand:- start:117 stop:506 length:390 start_codon:yes stop_codon:yes gene_type:complete